MLEQAVRLASQVVELKPDYPITLAALPHCLALRTGRIAGETARIFAGDALVAAGYLAEAEEALRQAVERDPRCSPLVHLILGWAMLLAGRLENALRELRLCVARLSDYARGYPADGRRGGGGRLHQGRLRRHAPCRRSAVGLAAGRRSHHLVLRRKEDRARCRRAFAMAWRIDAAARTGGLLTAPYS